MKTDHKNALKNAQSEVSYFLQLADELSKETETSKLWRIWIDLLTHYTLAVSAMRKATDSGPSKAWSDHLLNSQRKDPFLQYALHARNSAQHQYDGVRDAQPRMTSIGNMIAVGGNQTVHLSNNVIINADGTRQMMPEGTLEVRDGKHAGGSISKAETTEHPHYLMVSDVVDRGITWRVPNPSTPPAEQAIEIAKFVGHWLKDRLDEAKNLVSQKL